MATTRQLNAVGLRLGAAMGAENVFISPLSIGVCMGMVLAGTTEGGEAEAALLRAGVEKPLKYEAAQGELKAIVEAGAAGGSGVELAQANSLWARSEVKGTYAERMAADYHAKVAPLTTKAPINGFVADHTKGMIKELLKDEIDANTVAVLINAVFFKGSWTVPFDTKDTKPGAFTVAGGDVVRHPMMQRKFGGDEHKLAVNVAVGESRVDLLALPYGEGQGCAKARFFGVVALPTEKSADIRNVFNDVAGNAEALAEAVMGLRAQGPDTAVTLPKFKVEFGVQSLKDAMVAKLGLAPIFKAGGFARMSDDPLLVLDDVLHKVVIDVNEEGTTAAAATAAIMTRSLPRQFCVDRPFLFGVWDGALGVWAFFGKVGRPTV